MVRQQNRCVLDAQVPARGLSCVFRGVQSVVRGPLSALEGLVGLQLKRALNACRALVGMRQEQTLGKSYLCLAGTIEPKLSYLETIATSGRGP